MDADVWGSIAEYDTARALEERIARLQERRKALARLPHHALVDGTVARSHRIKGASAGTVHAVAKELWRAACGADPGNGGSWSTALDEEITCPRCLKKLA
jgi:hypothetical protein